MMRAVFAAADVFYTKMLYFDILMRLLHFVLIKDYVKCLFLCLLRWAKKDCEKIDSMLPCSCSASNHKRRQDVVRTSVTHQANTSCTFFVLTSYI